MPSMSLTTTQDVLAAAEHLPSGATLVIHEFSWEDYEQLLEALGERPGLRVSYDSGRLEILSTSALHENYGRTVDLITYTFADSRGLNLQSYGSATWKSKALGKGVEPDACYYVKNVNRVLGQDDIRLETHPPPDIAVEIDITNSSLRKLSIYAALSVSEIWRYDGGAFTFYTLTKGKYVEIPESGQLSGLTGSMLLEALEDCRTRGPIIALKAFRRRLRTTKR
jgi:Uma2 family endonuclease